MTVLVSVKINDGVVMAADSASSSASGMVYRHADKIVNLRQGLPIGAMVTGAGGIGNESIDTLLKDLRRRFNGEDEVRRDWALDPARYTLAGVANRLRTFLFEEKAAAYAGEVWTRVRLCGYSAGRPLAEGWKILLLGPNSPAPTQVQGEHEFGIRWDGEYEALSRLIFGLGTGFEDAAAASGLDPDAARELHAKLSPALFELLFVEAMPIRDAVDLARFLVETTIGFVKFSIVRPKTVGGSIAIAAVTKHEGFQWVQRQNGFDASYPVLSRGAVKLGTFARAVSLVQTDTLGHATISSEMSKRQPVPESSVTMRPKRSLRGLVLLDQIACFGQAGHGLDLRPQRCLAPRKEGFEIVRPDRPGRIVWDKVRVEEVTKYILTKRVSNFGHVV
jgi:hypothetical protein